MVFSNHRITQAHVTRAIIIGPQLNPVYPNVGWPWNLAIMEAVGSHTKVPLVVSALAVRGAAFGGVRVSAKALKVLLNCGDFALKKLKASPVGEI